MRSWSDIDIAYVAVTSKHEKIFSLKISTEHEADIHTHEKYGMHHDIMQ
jgi:hypothetical protein